MRLEFLRHKKRPKLEPKVFKTGMFSSPIPKEGSYKLPDGVSLKKSKKQPKKEKK